MDQPMKKPAALHAALIGVAGAACTAIPFGLFAVPGLFGYLLLTGGVPLYALSLAVCAGCACFLAGGAGGLYVLALILPISLCLCGMLKRKTGYFDAALTVAAITAALAYLAFNLGDLLAGNSAFSTMQAVYSSVWNEALAFMQQSAMMDPAYLQELSRMGREIELLLPTMMPAFICSLGALSGLLNVLCCAKIALKSGARIAPMRRFTLWQLPKSFGYGMLAIGGGLAVMLLFGYGALEAMLAAALTIALLPFAVQGLALLWFVLLMRKQRPLMRALLIALLVFSFPMCILSLSALGILEQCMRLRHKFLLRGNDNNNP